MTSRRRRARSRCRGGVHVQTDHVDQLVLEVRVVGDEPDLFARVIAANTFLPTGDKPPGDAIMAWQKFSQESEEFPIGSIINGGCTSKLSAEVVAAFIAAT